VLLKVIHDLIVDFNRCQLNTIRKCLGITKVFKSGDLLIKSVIYKVVTAILKMPYIGCYLISSIDKIFACFRDDIFMK